MDQYEVSICTENDEFSGRHQVFNDTIKMIQMADERGNDSEGRCGTQFCEYHQLPQLKPLKTKKNNPKKQQLMSLKIKLSYSKLSTPLDSNLLHETEKSWILLWRNCEKSSNLVHETEKSSILSWKNCEKSSTYILRKSKNYCEPILYFLNIYNEFIVKKLFSTENFPPLPYFQI